MKTKLPLPVLYVDKESWYLEDSQPLAIFLIPNQVAVYVHNLPRMSWEEAKQTCVNMEIEQLYWIVPNRKQWQVMLDKRELFERTAKLLQVDGLHNSIYWGRTKAANGLLGVDFALEKEVVLARDQMAYVRPFLFM